MDSDTSVTDAFSTYNMVPDNPESYQYITVLSKVLTDDSNVGQFDAAVIAALQQSCTNPLHYD